MDWTSYAFLISAVAVIGSLALMLWNEKRGKREAAFWEIFDWIIADDPVIDPRDWNPHSASFWQDRDPTLADLNAKIARAKRNKKKRSHLEGAKTARVHELLRG
jgi:hypothetical protein